MVCKLEYDEAGRQRAGVKREREAGDVDSMLADAEAGKGAAGRHEQAAGDNRAAGCQRFGGGGGRGGSDTESLAARSLPQTKKTEAGRQHEG